MFATFAYFSTSKEYNSTLVQAPQQYIVCPDDKNKACLEEGERSKAYLEKAALLGQKGDFFGGMLNPALGFSTLLLLAINAFFQFVQLSEARSQASKAERIMSIQGFEQGFFSLLSNYRELLDYISIEATVESIKKSGTVITITSENTNTSKLLKGRDALTYLWNQHMQWETIRSAVFAEGIESNHLSSNPSQFDENTANILIDVISRQFNAILLADLSNIFPLLRSITITLEWIDSHEDRFSVETKRFASILISSLSTTELLMIFFHSLHSKETNEKTIEIFSKHGLFSFIRYKDDSNLFNNVYTFSKEYGVRTFGNKFPDSVFEK